MAYPNPPVHQAAALAHRLHHQDIQVTFVSSLGTNRWVIPKGCVEGGLSPHDSAEKEAYEEAGLHGDVAETAIGSYDYQKTPQKGGRHCWVEVFPMRVLRALADWPEKDFRRRIWMKPGEAAASVAEPQLGSLILRPGEYLATHENGGRVAASPIAKSVVLSA